MVILVVGDVVGRPGRKAVADLLPPLRDELRADFAIVNAENAAGGTGVTEATARELLDAGADVLTTGNHVWQVRESYPYLDSEERLLRPANFPPGAPGRGFGVFNADGIRVAVANLQGRTFMQPIDDPFRCADSIVEQIRNDSDIRIVDIHAEATSEKLALACYLDGRVSCVFGTHTHVATADERILPGGTAFITDVGMTGPAESIIGMRPDAIIERFVTGLPSRFDVARGKGQLNGVLLDIDETSGLARSIARVRRGQE